MNKKIEIKSNFIDKVVGYFNPQAGMKRTKFRTAMNMLGGYSGASRTRRSLKEWMTTSSDANSDILPALSTLRDRSRDLIRNNPLAAGAIKTKVTNVVGTGLRLQSRIDRDILPMSDTIADDWEKNTEREWNLFWNSKNCDITKTMDGHALTRLVYRQGLENGDVFVLLPRKKDKDFPYDLRLQVIEADRVSNPQWAADTQKIAGGIEIDNYGCPVKYYIQNDHPGNKRMSKSAKWDVVPAFGKKLGLRNVIHPLKVDRPGQSRGVPDLTAVIEPLKQLGRYTDAELMAAVISGLFTVFIESDAIDPTNPYDPTNLADEVGSSLDDDDKKLGNGLIVGLEPGAKVHDSNPGRPNSEFDPFTMSILRQIGVALELPYEILIKHFTASYSAARAALLEAWKYFISERQWLINNFLKVVYEVWMYEAVLNGRITAPGFLLDSATRNAYLGADFVGPSKGQIDELKEIKAAKERCALGASNISIEAAEMGRNWDKIHPQSVKEFNARKESGLILEKQGGVNAQVVSNRK